jgi:RimJ/RimL family protein N-acetyltransferase
MTPPVLEEGPFTLRLPRTEDVSWVFHACQDPEIQRFTLIPVPYRPADAVAWVNLAATRCEAGVALDFVVARTESGELLGAATLKLMDADGTAELGYWVDRDARREGVATAAVTALERHAAGELGIRSTRLRIAVDNLASRGLAVALGYELAGADEDLCKGLETVSYVKSLASS